jgi:hypothetical protein
VEWLKVKALSSSPSTKIKKSCQVWWYMSVIPAEMGRLWFEVSLGKKVSKTPSQQKLSHAWGCIPVIPATWETQVGEDCGLGQLGQNRKTLSEK